MVTVLEVSIDVKVKHGKERRLTNVEIKCMVKLSRKMEVSVWVSIE